MILPVVIESGMGSGREFDVTADVPAHMAESLEMLGFELMHGETMPLEQPKTSPVAKQRKVAAAAKARRRERRGERRARGSQGKTKRR